ncbi:MAG: AgmX/PglI C-terminal domain-containing protein [Polyangiaceae bacterium]|nr:AgmX/PglI C-terminal domain-containing protein [Myxococcales bacterium]MCB9585489.1 AgmX/PglI C-terminal domain-containing protein [Polyangiaceae bacterium]MCB9606495.1 AgmX/PglI C-terminal domain-containing protein [Polyangiaceae bacterium]
MRTCAWTNLLTASVLTGVILFGCEASTLRSTAPSDTDNTEVAPPTVGEPTGNKAGDSSGSAAGGDEGSTGGAEGSTGGDEGGEGAQAGGTNPADGKSRTWCPLDEGDGSKAPEVAGVAGKPRDIETMQKIVQTYRGCVRRCYEAVQKEIPGLKGDLTMSLVITPKGKVKEATMNKDRSTLFTPKIVDCAANTLKKLEFGEHPKGMESKLNYPFNFAP